MRWSEEGAQLLAQVRVHALNGDLRPQELPIPLRAAKPKADPWLDGYLLRQATYPHFGALSIRDINAVVGSPLRSSL